MPIYPNALNFLPKPSRASRAVPLILNNLEPSRSAITRLKNRWARKGPGGSNPSSSASKLKTTLKLRRFFFRSKMANACLFYPSFIPVLSQFYLSFIPTVSKTVRPERAAVWKTAASALLPRRLARIERILQYLSMWLANKFASLLGRPFGFVKRCSHPLHEPCEVGCPKADTDDSTSRTNAVLLT